MSKEKILYDLPAGWAWTTLKEITLPIIKTNSEYENANESFKYIDIEAIDNKEFVLKEPKRYLWSNAPSRAQQKVKTNDILFANVRPYLKNIALVSSQYDGEIASTGFCIIRPLIVNYKYVFYYVLSKAFIDSINKLAKGTSYPAVTNKIILEQNIALPPLKQQGHIIEKIEELFSELAQVEKAFKKANRQVEIYKQALLKKAFEGRLTSKWRKENKPEYQLSIWVKQKKEEEYKKRIQKWESETKLWLAKGRHVKRPVKPSKLKLVESFHDSELEMLPGLPRLYWKWVKLNELTLGVEYGTSAKSGKKGKAAVLRMGNIQNGAFDWSDLVFTSDEIEIKKYLLSNGDVLFNRTNSPELVGKSAVYESEHIAIFAGYLIRVNQIETIVNSKYLNYFLNSPFAKKYGNSVMTNGVNQANINGDKLIHYPIPICTLKEQIKIIEELDSQFTIIENLEKAIKNGLRQAEFFRYVIFKKAFEGKLVNQNSNDETAEMLLQIIQNEKRNYILVQEEEKKSKPKKMKMAEKNHLSALQILKNIDEPILAKDLWQQSVHKDNIEDFYAELKEIHIQLIEVKNETESLLSLK